MEDLQTFVKSYGKRGETVLDTLNRYQARRHGSSYEAVGTSRHIIFNEKTGSYLYDFQGRDIKWTKNPKDALAFNKESAESLLEQLNRRGKSLSVKPYSNGSSYEAFGYKKGYGPMSYKEFSEKIEREKSMKTMLNNLSHLLEEDKKAYTPEEYQKLREQLRVAYSKLGE